MTLTAARVVLVAAGFALWAWTSALPMSEAIREGWDRPAYWQIGLPLIVIVQIIVAILSNEKMTLAPLWVLLGHAVAMLFVAPAGSDFGLIPLSLIFVAIPLYAVLVLAALGGRIVRGLTGLAS